MDSTFQQTITAPFQNLTSLNHVHLDFPEDIHVTHENAKPIIILFSLLSFHLIIRPDFLAKFKTWKEDFYIQNKTTTMMEC
jgi:hypothetical protein